jgi:hypothetical protein
VAGGWAFDTQSPGGAARLNSIDLSGCLPGRNLQEAVDVTAGRPLGFDGIHTPGADRHMVDVAPRERHIVEHLPSMIELAELGRGPLLGVGAHGPVSETQSDIERMSKQR